LFDGVVLVGNERLILKPLPPVGECSRISGRSLGVECLSVEEVHLFPENVPVRIFEIRHAFGYMAVPLVRVSRILQNQLGGKVGSIRIFIALTQGPHDAITGTVVERDYTARRAIGGTGSPSELECPRKNSLPPMEKSKYSIETTGYTNSYNQGAT
jgi:hypothetical protein